MSGSSRVSIPDSLRKTIQDIREITGKHKDEDIYAVLKDCNMDPDETAQKLLYLDTFEEVKRKRDRRKVSVNSRAFGEHRQRPGMQWRGTKGDNRYSSYNSDGGRRQENGYRRTMGRTSKSSTPPVLHNESNKIPAVASSVSPSHGSTRGSSSHESTSHSIISGKIIKDTKGDYEDIKSRKLSSLWVKQLSDLDHPGPTPTSTPTNPSTARIPHGSLSSHLGNSSNGCSLSVSGVLYSSASDPVLVPSLEGIIKREPRNPCNGPSEEMFSEEAGVASEDNLRSKQATSELDVKLHKLRISARQSVIFPEHLRVPEALKNTLTFGSLDPPFLDSNRRDASVPTNNIEASRKSSPTPQENLHESPPHVPVNLASSQENISSRNDQSKVGRSHDSLVTPTSDYCPSLAVGSHLVQLQQGGSSLLTTGRTTPSPTQPRGVSQSCVSPQLFPFFRQPYPPNYVPYGPYYSQAFMPPQNVNQLMSHSGFPHQLSAGNIYKFPIPPGNMTHFGISSGYGSYGASSPGSGSGAALPTS